LRILTEAFRGIQISSSSGICIVSGHPGCGKTSLVHEAMERMEQEGALVACAKFDQYSEDVPYTATVQALYSILIVGPVHL
jgi:predicted ATPase